MSLVSLFGTLYGWRVATVPNSDGLVSEQVFRTLLEAILAGRYAPGEKLPGQRALAADAGVTMTSLREALKRLEQMGLVDVRHGDAMRVRDWREHGGLDVLAHLVLRSGVVDAKVMGDVLDARALMLRELAGLAASRATGEQAAGLEELAGRFAEQDADASAAALVDFAFFTAVARAADNIVFDLILNGIRALYFEHLELVPVTARPHELAPHYTRIAAAIGKGEAQEARAAAYELARLQAQRVQEALGT
jgi:GntR family transcriptional repressor for pyruvate dehydrogenase complex